MLLLEMLILISQQALGVRQILQGLEYYTRLTMELQIVTSVNIGSMITKLDEKMELLQIIFTLIQCSNLSEMVN